MNLFPNKTDSAEESPISRLRAVLKQNGFELQDSQKGIRIVLDQLGLEKGTLDLYALPNNSGHLRARIRRELSESPPQDEELEELSLHTRADLEFVRNELQEGLAGMASVGRFHYFGFRRGAHFYYAHVKPEMEPSDIILRQRCAEKALSQLKGVDSKLFRQALDSLGLARSSIVRLGLTRIFRGAADSEELLKAAHHEAQRIVTSEEWKTVRELKENNQVPFMTNIVYILWEEVTKIYMKRAWQDLHE